MRTAGRAHRPGSRRLGGVEAPGASPATGASWPDRRKGWASPGRGPVLPISRGGCVDPNPGGPTWGVPQIAPWGRRLAPPGGASTASTNGFYLPGPYGAPLAGVSRYSPPAMFPGRPGSQRPKIGRPPSRGRRATWRRRSGGGRASTAEGRVREMKSPTDASSICEARISPVATASGDFL